MKIMRVREPFTYDENGQPVSFAAGDLVDVETVDGYKGREHLFEDVSVYVGRRVKKNAPVIETATRKPDSPRAVTTLKTGAKNG